ncbi:MAG: hypothetical protein ACD_69C00349G0002 [uncultured bacterium]|nr:MAG: hypothetical protein ACD_69C00349G0002 [uncultured bacterium]
MKGIDQSRLEFWNSRASLGLAAGSNDIIAKELEIINISKLLEGCKYVLDAGCGNGITALTICKNMKDLSICAFDYSEAMVMEARKLSQSSGYTERLVFKIGELTNPPFETNYFDAVYTERSLINLSSINEQKIAIAALLAKLKRGGKLILVESFKDGLEEINTFRNSIGLNRIEPPWHNCYLNLKDLDTLIPKDGKIESILKFSSTYYFLSRVINAWFSQLKMVEPSYDAPINKLAFQLPSIEICAQVQIVVIRKN